jgi:competence protein ComFC
LQRKLRERGGSEGRDKEVQQGSLGAGIAEGIRYLFDCALEVIYWGEAGCITCGGECSGEAPLCCSCASGIEECGPPLKLSWAGLDFYCYSAAYYCKAVRELVLRLKYKGDFRSAEVLAGLMAKVIEGNLLEADFLTFVPSSRTARRKRGYNQSEALAKLISKETGIRVKGTLAREEGSKDQIGLGKAERWENIEGSFRLGRGADVAGKTFILVDDVVTTGATAFWCAETLAKNGAEGVVVLTAAKSGV